MTELHVLLPPAVVTSGFGDEHILPVQGVASPAVRLAHAP